MNTSQGALHFGAGIDLTQWRRDVDQMRRDIVGFSQDTQNQTRNIDSAFKSLSIGIASYFSVSAMKSFTMELINVRGEFQKTEIAYSTMLGSVDKAKALMGDMVELAAKTPFSLTDVTDGAKRLLAFQVPADQVLDTLTRLGNISAGLSVPMSSLILVYGQVMAKGRLMGDDLRQFTEAGIPMVAELAKKFNKTSAEISDMVSAGKIGFKDVQDVLFGMTNQGGMFFNLMEKQSKSLSGQVANLGDAWDQMLNKIGESQEGLLSDGIQGITYLVEHYRDVIQIVSTLVGAYGAYKAVLITVSALQKAQIWAEGTLAAVRFAQGISGMTRAQLLFNAAASANPYVLLASGIAAVIAALVYFRTANTDAKEEAEKLTAALEYQKLVSDSVAGAYKKSSEAIVGSIEKEIAILKSSYSSAEMRKKAYESLVKINKTFIGTVDSEYRATALLGKAYLTLISRLKELAIAKGKAALLEELSKKKAQADLDLVLKQDSYEKQRAKNIKTRAENDKKLSKFSKSSLYYEVMVEQNVDYSAYNPAKAAIKTRDEITKQFDLLANDVTKGIADATKKNDKELKDAWGNIGEATLETGPKKGTEEWYKAEIDRLEALKAKAVVGSKAWNAYRLQIEKYNELLSPKKEKSDNKQFAEIIPDGSIADLERKAQLLTDALRKVENGVVKLRKLDQYGNDKDKNGNPFLTGENVSVEEAKNRLKKVNEDLAAKRKEIQIQTFDEELAETERQWKVRYQLANHYGDEVAKAMFPKLKGDSYYSEINKIFSELDDKFKLGVISEEELQNLNKVKTILDGLNGTKDPFTQFNDDLDKDLLKLKTNGEKVDLLNEKLSKLTEKQISSGYKAEIFNLLNSLQKEEQNQYQQLLDNHQSFNDKKLNIERDTAIAIKKIREDESLSPEKKKSAENSIDRKSKEEISQLAVDELTQSQAWMALYGNIEELTAAQMDILLKELEAKQGTLSKLLTPVDFKILLKNFRDVKNRISEENPFLGLFNSLQDLFTSFSEKSEEAGEQSESAFEKASKAITSTSKAAKGILDTLSPIREYLSDAANDAIDFIGQVATVGIASMEVIGQTAKLVNTTITKATFSNWITALIQIIYTAIKAIVSLFSWIAGNKTKKINREIKSWQAAVDDLKTSYEELQTVIEKTAGEAQLSMQRGLIQNLQQQQKILEQMRAAESKKKKSDQQKIATYTNDIRELNNQIQEIVDDFKLSVTTVDFKDLADNLATALIEAFGQGEDAALSFEKVADEVMKNAVTNALKIKFLQPVAEEFVDKLYSAMGFGTKGGSKEQQDAVDTLNQAIADIDKKLLNANSLTKVALEGQKKHYQEVLNKLKADIAAGDISGVYDGLSQSEIDILKNDYKNDPRIQGFLEGIKNVNELFDTTFEAAQSLKGDIKGITEKTAGALEAQFNAVRINIAAIFQFMKKNHIVGNAQTVLLSKIEVNTRNLHQIRKDISELNQKTKAKLAGLP